MLPTVWTGDALYGPAGADSATVQQFWQAAKPKHTRALASNGERAVAGKSDDEATAGKQPAARKKRRVNWYVPTVGVAPSLDGLNNSAWAAAHLDVGILHPSPSVNCYVPIPAGHP
jgi:hypothetical protein